MHLRLTVERIDVGQPQERAGGSGFAIHAAVSRAVGRRLRQTVTEIRLDDLGIVAHLLAGAFGDLLAFVHDDDTVGETHHHLELVLDQQDRQAFGFQFGDQPLHFAGLGRVHAGGRFVEQQQPRLERQRTRDFDTAPVGVGQAVSRLIDAAAADARRTVPGSPLPLRAAAPLRPSPTAGRNSASPSSSNGPISGTAGLTARSRVCAPIRTFSITLRLPNTRPSWNVRAMPRPASLSGEKPVIGLPSKPDLAARRAVSSPVTRLNRVVLPAPFGPMMLTSSPLARSRSMSSTAVRPPKRRVSPRRDSKACGAG